MNNKLTMKRKYYSTDCYENTQSWNLTKNAVIQPHFLIKKMK